MLDGFETPQAQAKPQRQNPAAEIRVCQGWTALLKLCVQGLAVDDAKDLVSSRGVSGLQGVAKFQLQHYLNLPQPSEACVLV